MPFAEVNGQRLHYEDTGRGPVVIFSHGLLMDWEMFRPQVDALRGEFRCVAWDQRGHGLTGEATVPFSFWDSADDLRELAVSLDIDRAFLVGMSQGGFASMRAALRYPDFVLGLGLIDTQAGVEDADLVPQYRIMAETWQEHGLNDDLAAIIAGIIMSPGYPGNAAWIAKWKALPREHLDVPLQPLFDREDIHDRLGDIVCPAIVFHGEVDAAIPMELAGRLAAGLPNCDGLVRIPGAGHASNLSHPDAVNEPLREFLRRHALATERTAT